jgi:dihydrofolate reductase
MRKLIVTEFISLDGVIDSPGGEPGYAHSGWTFNAVESDPAMYDFKLEETLESSALLLGRVTYDGFAAAWPSQTDAFGEKFNSMPKYVASTTLTDPTWNNTTVLEGDTVAAIRSLKEADGGPILVGGSGNLVATLYAADLVDEWRLMVFPVILGSGKRLFPTDVENMSPLKLTSSRTFTNGVQLNIFEPVR